MASLADTMLQGTMNALDPAKFVKAPDASEAFTRGAQIAQARENAMLEKQKLEQESKKIQETQIGKFNEFLFKAMEAKDPKARAGYLKMAPRVRDTYGISPDVISDDAIQAMNSSDEDAGRAYTLANAVKTPGSPLFGKPDQAMRIFNNPEERIKIESTPPELRTNGNADLGKATSEYLEWQGKQQQMAQSAAQFQQGQAATEMRAQRSDKIQLTDRLNTLGIPALKASIKNLDKQLGGFDNWKGGDIPGMTGAEAKLPGNRLSPKGAANRQAARAVANQILKMRSGGAVSDGEASRMLSEIGMTASILEDGSWKTLFTGSPTPEAFINGMKGVRNTIGSVEESMAQGYGRGTYESVIGAPLKTADSAPVENAPQRKVLTQDKSINEKVDKATNWVKANAANLVKAAGGKAGIKAQLLSRGFTDAQAEKILTGAGVK